MTTINNMEDLIRILQERPEWQAAARSLIVGEELAQLPGRVTKLEESLAVFIQATDRNFQLVHQRLERLEGDFAGPKEGQARLEGGFAGLKEGQARLEGGFAGLKEGQARLEGDFAGPKEGQARLEGGFAGLKEGQARLEGDFAGPKEGQARLEGGFAGLKEGQARLEGGFAGLKEGQARLEATQTRMSGQLGILVGSNFEGRASRLAPRHVRRILGISRTEVVYSFEGNKTAEFNGLLDSAVEAGAITEDEADELRLTDLVLAGQDQQGQQGQRTYVVLEVSVTAQQQDADRALDRAGILEKATGLRALPAVMAATGDEDALRPIDFRGVPLLVAPDD